MILNFMIKNSWKFSKEIMKILKYAYTGRDIVLLFLIDIIRIFIKSEKVSVDIHCYIN